MNEKWLSVDDVAAELQVARMTVYRMLSAGVIPAYKFGRLYRVRPEDLQAYIRDSRVPVKAAAEGT